MPEHRIKFATLNEDGSLSKVREIKQADINRCPHFILVPDHYRQDGSCRCDDPNHLVMDEWGYTWSGERWQ